MLGRDGEPLINSRRRRWHAQRGGKEEEADPYHFLSQIYAFRTITCDYLYEDGTLPPYTGDDDRCATREIESQTAADISLMVTFTTASGVLNLITTGWYMRRWGVRTALVMQTLWPCLRNVCQTFAGELYFHRFIS